MRKVAFILLGIAVLFGFFSSQGFAAEQSKEIKIGVLVSITGAFAPAGGGDATADSSREEAGLH